MGSPTVNLRLESIPTVDLRLFSQSELCALAQCSTNAFNPLRCDDVVIPKIDRSVFNESAGSRKQTYSRLRLAPRNPEISTSQSRSRTSLSLKPDPDIAENRRIIGLLKDLFASESRVNDLTPIHVESLVSSHADYGEITTEITNVGQKRKRGRPRKSENYVVENDSVESVKVKNEKLNVEVDGREKVIVNKNGAIVDIVALASLDDPFGFEMRRRTAGFVTEDEFIGFLNGLNGTWNSNRKKKMVVDAGDFGNVLPVGWKLLISLKRRQGQRSLICRKYISPNGRQFVSCKEVSSYLLSLLGPSGVTHLDPHHGVTCFQLANTVAPRNAAERLSDHSDKKDNLVCYTPSSISSVSIDQDKQVTRSEMANPRSMPDGGPFRCHKCTMTYDEKDDLLNHHLSYHKRARRNCKEGTPLIDEGMNKVGIYECQLCSKVFHERRRNFGHIGSHVKSHVKKIETSSQDVATEYGRMEPEAETSAVMTDVSTALILSDCVNSSMDEPDNLSCFSNSTLRVKSTAGLDGEINIHGNGKSSHNLEEMKTNRNVKPMVEESCHWQVDDYKVTTDGAALKVGEAATIIDAKSDFSSLGSKTAFSNNENNSFSKATDSTTNNKCTAPPERWLQTCVVGSDLSKISITTTKEIHLKAASEINGQTSYGNKTMSHSANKVEMFSNASVEDLNINGEGENRNNEPYNNFGSDYYKRDEAIPGRGEQERSPEDSSLVSKRDEHICAVVNKMHKQLASTVAVSNQNIGSERGLLVTYPDEKPSDRSNSSNFCTTMGIRRPTSDEVDCSESNTLSLWPRCQQTRQFVAAVSDKEPVGIPESHSTFPSCAKQMVVVKNNNTWFSACGLEELKQRNVSKSSPVTPSATGQNSGFKDNVVEVSTATMKQHNQDQVKDSDNHQLLTFFGSSDGEHVGAMSRAEQRQCFVPSGIGNTYGVDNVENRTSELTAVEQPNLELGSEFSLLAPFGNDQTWNFNESTDLGDDPKVNEVQISRNNKMIESFGIHVGLELDADSMSGIQWESNSEGCTFLSGGKQNPDLESASENLLSPYVTQQACHVENDLSSIGAGTRWRVPTITEGENSGTTNFMTALGHYNPQSDHDNSGKFIHRTEEERRRHDDLPDRRSQAVQTPGYFPIFDFVSEKGENIAYHVNEKFDDRSHLERPRSGGMDHFEFNFLSAETSASLQDPKVLSFDSRGNNGFDSSIWLEKEAFLPKTAGSHQSTVICMWCRDEFHEAFNCGKEFHESFVSGSQAGAIGFICPTCKAKFSGRLNAS